MIEFLTDPIVVTILLTIAGVGIVLELFSAKIGIAGFIGVFALILFFYGHFQAGLAGYGTLTLFVAGILLIFLEFFLPGAVAGTLGVAALILSLFLAGEDAMQIGVSIFIAIMISIIVFFMMIKTFGKKLVLFNKMVLSEIARKEDGYVSNINRTDLLGKVGTALTILRPAGTIIIHNERVDAISEGGFIEQNAKVKVIKVEGARIVVREVK
ncbi:nodulation efficiency protein NfeD [Neobacillus sp. MM2021_6]|uniref:NfeD family protein n=1 Tax=Bacillaceae TaxID=186817 RepID=UPI00140B3B59|nr:MULTISPECIES: NfeD family protein [Bacillaceae]MBO0959452.1 nodulation efficiency protein NfeD [Neobacillus sp. MM2021_6]NHC17250.1 nodulation efficiency protein NfeD [Bacillus sp. MM2020_4]WML40606.1 NfeD family protein [Neobacillus sp. OS1-2]